MPCSPPTNSISAPPQRRPSFALFIPRDITPTDLPRCSAIASHSHCPLSYISILSIALHSGMILIFSPRLNFYYCFATAFTLDCPSVLLCFSRFHNVSSEFFLLGTEFHLSYLALLICDLLPYSMQPTWHKVSQLVASCHRSQVLVFN